MKVMDELRDIEEKIMEYLNRAYTFKENFDDVILRENNLEKASEFLWGMFSCYLNAVYLLKKGKPTTSHKELMNVAWQLVNAFEDENLKEAVKLAEKCHANFYHGILDRDELKKCYNAIMYAILKIESEIFRRI